MGIATKDQHFYYKKLRKLNLFNEVSNQSLKDLLDLSTPEYWPKKTCLINSTKTLYKFYIIISGKLKVYNFDHKNDRQFTLFLLRDNDLFDVFSLIKAYKHNAHYETLEDSEMLSIPIYEMREWISINPIINKSFLDYTLNKMLILEDYLNDIILEDTPTRLAKLILKNLNQTTYKIEFINNLTHKELAQLIGTTRAVLNRHLQYFKEKGILKFKRNQIEISNLKKLEEIIKKGNSKP